MLRASLALLLAGCIAQATAAISPPSSGGGTLTCREIVVQCDSQCTNPLCVRRCGDNGTLEAAQLHNAVVDCAQRYGCLDEPCIRANCGQEAEACQGPEEPPPAVEEETPAEPPPPAY